MQQNYLGSALKKDENYYLQVFLKESRYSEKEVVRHIHDNLSNFSYHDDESDEYDERQIKAMKLIFIEKGILKRFLREQFWKCLFSKRSFLKQQF